MKNRTLVAATILVVGWILVPSAWAICRVVEPYADSGPNPVVFDPTTMALIVMAPDQTVDYDCPPAPEGCHERDNNFRRSPPCLGAAVA